MGGEGALQEVHLVREDSTVLHDEGFGWMWHVGNIQQAHSALGKQFCCFLSIAIEAATDHIGPNVKTAATSRNDMVSAQLASRKFMTAISTDVAIAKKQAAIG